MAPSGHQTKQIQHRVHLGTSMTGLKTRQLPVFRSGVFGLAVTLGAPTSGGT